MIYRCTDCLNKMYHSSEKNINVCSACGSKKVSKDNNHMTHICWCKEDLEGAFNKSKVEYNENNIEKFIDNNLKSFYELSVGSSNEILDELVSISKIDGLFD